MFNIYFSKTEDKTKKCRCRVECRCRVGCLEEPLRRCFRVHGDRVSRHPVMFVLAPVLLTVALGSGLVMLFYNGIVTDTASLYIPTYGLNNVMNNQDTGTLKFGIKNTSTFEASLRVILSADWSNILHKVYINYMMDLDNLIRNVTVENSYRYEDICSKFNGSCPDNSLPEEIYLRNNISQKDRWGSVYRSLYNHGSKHRLGDFYAYGDIYSARAIMLNYYVSYNNIRKRRLTYKWLAKCTAVLATKKTSLFEITYYTTTSLGEELKEATYDVMVVFGITYFMIVTFCLIATTIFGNWVTSKPCLAIAGVLSSTMAILSCFGLLSLCQAPFASQVAIVPYLVLGKIGFISIIL